MTQDDVIALLKELVSRDATELHFKVPARPLLKVEGRLVPTSGPPMTPQTCHRLATALMGLARLEIPLATVQHREFSFGVPGVGRFHTVLYRQRSSLAVSLTRIPHVIPTLADLGVDNSAEAVLTRPGLTLICGDRRRAALLASLVDRFNASRRGLAVVIEDPLTHLHRDATAVIAQRGVGTDTGSFAEGVCSARRQGVDLIAVGDVPDRTTAEALLRAAEEDITVLACVAAPDPNLAPTWLTRHFASERDQDVKQRLKRLLRGVICIHGQGPARIVTRRGHLSKAS